MSKRGPNTEAGKARAAQNALKHGIFAAVPAVEGLAEAAADWHAHREGVVEGLAPEGYLEETLADRAATLLWRLARLARYETSLLEQSIRAVEEVTAGAKAADLEELRTLYALPGEKDLARIVRYEAHLNRQLQSTLRELETLQDRRRESACIGRAGKAEKYK